MNRKPSLNDVYGFGGTPKHKHHHTPSVKGPVMSGYGPVFPQQRNSTTDVQPGMPTPSTFRPVPPTITTQPVAQTVAKLSSVTFFVTATGTGPLAYQWQRNANDIVGADQATYTIPKARMGMDGNPFRCVVSNSVGFVNSNDAILNVTDLAPVIPTGLFSLTPGVGNKPINDLILLNPDVDGVVIATRWCNCESERGVYDFAFLIEQVQRVTDAGKKAILGISTGNMGEGAGGNKPDWVMAACADNTFSYYDTSPGGLGLTKIPVFWHPLLLQYKCELYAALGATFAGNDTITMFACNSANAQTEDWAVPDDGTTIDGIPPLNSTQVSRWMTAGYTHAKMVAAAAQIADCVATAFPQACIYFPMGKIHSLVMEPGGPDALAQDIINTIRTAHGVTRLAVGRNTYSANTGPTDLQIANPPYAGQDLFFIFGDTTYRMNQMNPGDPNVIMQNTFNGVLDAKFLEVYEKDIVNLSPAVIHNGHVILYRP